MNILDVQVLHRASDKFGDDHPEAMRLAMRAINEWGRETKTLNHALAFAIQEAYEAGQAGNPLPGLPEPAQTPIMRRRSPAPTAPEPIAPTVRRRAR